MTDYVLVHGAWHGSWCWKRVRRMLTAKGHQVFTPTLTGLGERVHLLSQDVSLDTHIADVVNLLIWEDLRDIVLVGHSYGGAVVRHVADQLPDRVRSLVYLDAFVPEDGKSVLMYLPNSGRAVRELARTQGDGWKAPPIPASALGINEMDAAWVDGQCTMQPLASLEAEAHLSGNCDTVATIGYILASGWEGSPFLQFYELAGEQRWWRADLACGHDAMLDAPDELAALLLQLT